MADGPDERSQDAERPMTRGSQTRAMLFEYDADEDADITKFLTGSKAIVGKAAWAAQADLTARQAEERHRHEEREAEARAAAELAHLAQWNQEMTDLGGYRMTNEEAQKARQHVIDHADEFAARSVRDGHIREDEKEDYKRTIRRIRDLEEKRGRGIASEEEQRECESLKRSRVGRAAEHDAGAYHAQARGHDNVADAKLDIGRSDAGQTSPALESRTLFEGAPALNDHFEQAKEAATPLDKKPQVTPAPLSPRVAAMGVSV